MTNLKLAFRNLLRNPVLTSVATLSLALGIGANSAIFSLFDQILLDPLPVQAPDRLVNLGAPGPKSGTTSCNDAGDCDEIFSYPMFRDLEREQTVFTGLAAHRSFGANLAFEEETWSGSGNLVSGSYFPTLGLVPTLGRLLGPNDDTAVGEARVAVLGWDAWTNRFGADPDVLNRDLVVNGHQVTIVGVAPESFRGTTLGSRPDVYVPITLRGLMEPGFDGFENRRSYWAYLFGRLRPGITPEKAETALNVPYRAILHDVEAPLQEGMSEGTLERFRAKRVTVAPGPGGQSSMRRESKTPMILLMAVAGVVLLIACANVANLLLAQAAGRGGEMAVRLSVGANRRLLVSQLLTEALVLATVGGLAGLLTAWWTLRLLGRLMPPEAADTFVLAPSPDVVVFTAFLALATGLLFGLFPALHSSRVDLSSVLRGQAGRQSGTRSASRFRLGLVGAQIALSTMLLASAGLFTRSLLNVSRVDLGLDSIDQVVTFGVSPQLNGYTPEQSLALFVRLEEELAALPGVSAVTASMVPLIAGSNWGSSLTVDGFDSGPDTDTDSRFNEVGPGYFRTLGIPLLRGREFTAADRATEGTRVAIVNEAFVAKFDLGDRAIGARFAQATGDAVELDTEIVGVVANSAYSSVKDEVPPLFFRPYRQNEKLGFLNFYVRAEIAPSTVLAAIPGVVSGLDPNLPVEELRTMPDQIRQNTFLDRFLTTLSASFAAVATLLAAIGLYGVLAFMVVQRTREIGLRMALGADRGRIQRLVLSQVALLVALGGGFGLLAAFAIGKVARSLLYEVEASDPATLLLSAALLGAVAFGAAYVPAFRASRIQPIRALRYE